MSIAKLASCDEVEGTLNSCVQLVAFILFLNLHTISCTYPPNNSNASGVAHLLGAKLRVSYSSHVEVLFCTHK